MTPTVMDEPQIETPAPARRAFADVFAVLALEQLVESGHNPRRHFDETKLRELAESVREKGIVEPLVVRPIDIEVDQPLDGTYEIVAGARRFRAAKAAGLSHVPCVVREYSDEDMLELFLIENVQRDDLAPLEQALGFKALLDANAEKYSASTIATKVGMSPQWVWDRLKLLDLVPEAQALLSQQRISAAHAIVIARLKPADQQRVIGVGTGSIHSHPGGLWEQGQSDGLAFDDELAAKRDKYHGLKPVTVRELEAWIDDHVRFDIEHAAQAQPLQFAEVAERVEAAQAHPGRGKKVIAVTFEGYVQPDAKSDERIYGPKSWRFADGEEHRIDPWSSKTRLFKRCDHAVLGVVVAGAQRGQTFDVCIARDKCTVHWKAEIAEKQKTQQLRDAGKSKQADKREASAAAKRAKEQAKEAAAEERWKKVWPPLCKAVVAAAEAVPAGDIPKPIFAWMLKAVRLPKDTTVEGLAKALLLLWVRDQFHGGWSWHGSETEKVATAKIFGVAIKDLEPPTSAETAPAASTPKSAKKPAKKAAKKR